MASSFHPAGLTIALAQCNPTVGDIAGNVALVSALRARAAEAGAELVIFPELTVTGYPPEDLVLRPSFEKASMEAVAALASTTADGGPALLVGGLHHSGRTLHNATFLLDGGQILHQQYKHLLPNYGVFDEKRVFAEGPLPSAVAWRGLKLGLLVCEDMWQKQVAAKLLETGAELLISQNASPYEMGKAALRRKAALTATHRRAPLIYLNMVGGQDELVFDGRSFALSAEGEDVARLRPFQEELGILRWEKQAGIWRVTEAPLCPREGDCETIYQAMTLGLRDYVEKNRFAGVVIGLSGGIDSGLSAAVAVDALGPDRVRAVMMPSPYTSRDSIEDAETCAKALGIRCDTLPITPGMESFGAMLQPLFAGLPADTTEENIQARLRGHLLMAISNKFGLMVLTTGNKSEMSVGYATLYGDMCGGYSVLKDVYKTTVFAIAHWRNAHGIAWSKGPKGRVIPERMITKPPSAELKPNQTDQDSLPPYAILDGILQGLVERRLGVDEVVKLGFDRETVVNVLRMLTRAEYKRRQAPPGVKVSAMSFGRDWRYPITNRFKN